MSRQVSGAAAIGFAVLIVCLNAVLVPAGLPTTGADTAQALAFFSSHEAVVRVASALAPVAWVLATVFGAGAVAVLRTAWAVVGFAGVLLQNLTFTAVMATRLALTTTPDPGLWALHDALFVFNGTFLALAMTGLSLAGAGAGLIRPWHSRIGLVAAALQFASAVLGPLVIEDPGPIGLLGLAGWLIWVVWLVAYGVALRSPVSATSHRAG
ncbi:hypothetical protein [Actinoplanes aureus]|uniref:hypothetical protein n=1 Tax=Actinoplanes aureus TaxID=2792083 RepID=UPI001E419EAB|nr:hypothetical protein [Actinoplanes aureus]